MTPPPTLQELIETVRADAPGDGPLEQLTQASQTASELEEVTDALLGHFVDRCRRQGHSWSEISAALGVSKQAAHKRFSPAPSGPPTFERFTPRAREALRLAAEQARRLGRSEVTSDHILLALFEPMEALAAQVLAQAGLTRKMVLAELRATPVGDAEVTPGDTPMPYSADARSVLRQTAMEALQLGHNYIGTEHLLLAITGLADTTAAAALVALGATRETIETIVAAMFAEIRRSRSQNP